MAVTHYDLTATFRDAEWTAFDPGSSPVVAWVETNVANTEGIIDEVADQISLGGSRKVADSAGLVTWTGLVGSDSTPADINLESGTLQYRVTAEYRNNITRRRERWVSGWFSLTADINLADVVSETYVPAAWMTTATATLQGYVTDAEAARDAAVDISNISTSDTVVEALVKNTGGAGPLTSAALSATYGGVGTVVYCGPNGNDSWDGRTSAKPKATLAAALTAIGTGVRGTVELLPGIIDVGSGVDLTGYAANIVGPGSRVTTLDVTSAQSGPALDCTGVTANNITMGGFQIIGDGIADATNTNKGIEFSHTVIPVGWRMFDILVSETGGSCFDFGMMELSNLDRLVAMPPVSAATNNIPWMEAHGAFNGNHMTRCGLLSLSLTANVGVDGAVRIYDDGTYTPTSNLFTGWWIQSLMLPTNGTIFDLRGNKNIFADFQFFDCAKDAGATGTFHMRWKPSAPSDQGGNEMRGVIPGRNTAGNAIEGGIDIQQSRNRVIGVKGFRGYNVTLAAGVANTYVMLGGAHAAATDAAVVDNSGVKNNVYSDELMRTRIMGEYKEDGKSLSGVSGPRFQDQTTPANGAVWLGTSDTHLKAVGTTLWATADNVPFRSIASATPTFTIATTSNPIGVTFAAAASLPTASATFRGRVAMIQGAAGVADRLVICRKDAADAYAWVDLF